MSSPQHHIFQIALLGGIQPTRAKHCRQVSSSLPLLGKPQLKMARLQISRNYATASLGDSYRCGPLSTRYLSCPAYCPSCPTYSPSCPTYCPSCPAHCSPISPMQPLYLHFLIIIGNRTLPKHKPLPSLCAFLRTLSKAYLDSAVILVAPKRDESGSSTHRNKPPFHLHDPSLSRNLFDDRVTKRLVLKEGN